MKKTDLTRRDFNRLSMAAFGGVVAGTFAGCADDAADAPAPPDSTLGDPADAGSGTTGAGDGGDGGDATDGGDGGDGGGDETASLLLGDKHVCRGLNTCKGKGGGGENACAGQGACATLGPHKCATTNDCKGQGGCGEKPGENACKGMGACAVPLKEHAWGKARANFEAAMKAADPDKPVGAAPAAAPAAAS